MRLLVFAYACEPKDGSEPGAGWTWGRLISGFGETWVITRSNNKEEIERGISDIPDADRPNFVYVDLPYWARFWKKGQRGVRLYYLLWQLAALRRARRLHKQQNFDVVWHVTLANAWLGSAAAFLPTRFVYGPVGGGVTVPRRLLGALGTKGLAAEVIRSATRWVGRYLNPLARVAWRRADLILTQNSETVDWLPRRYREKAAVLPNVVLPETKHEKVRQATHPTMMVAGRLLPWKGGEIAIRTLTHLSDWRLLVFGTGPDERRLRQLAEKSGVADRIEFRGWVDRDELLRAMHEEADVFLHASLREEAGWVVGEAQAAGIPVVALQQGGPPSLGARCVPATSIEASARALAEAAVDCIGKPDNRTWKLDMTSRRALVRDQLLSKGFSMDGAA